MFLSHDEGNVCRAGDVVRIEETRPLSKRKHFKVTDVLQQVETFIDPATGKVHTKFSK